MKKTTKEHAEKLAEKYIDKNYVDWAKSDPATQNSKDAYREGYLKAIEENAVPELIDLANQVVRFAKLNQGSVSPALAALNANAKAALKKATS